MLTLLVPGSAQLVAGNRKLARVGITATLTFWAIALVTIIVGLVDKNGLLFRLIPVNFVFGFLALILGIYGLLFAVLAIDTLRLMRLGRLYKRERWIAFAGLAMAAVLGTSGLSWAGNTACVSAGAIGSIFNQSGFTTPVDGRYNIMLLGADSGRDRFGLRPDSISVISIDATTGKVLVDARTWACRTPLAAQTPVATFYSALSGHRPLRALLPGTGVTIFDGLMDCLY